MKNEVQKIKRNITYMDNCHKLNIMRSIAVDPGLSDETKADAEKTLRYMLALERGEKFATLPSLSFVPLRERSTEGLIYTSPVCEENLNIEESSDVGVTSVCEEVLTPTPACEDNYIPYSLHRTVSGLSTGGLKSLAEYER
jgi:hypothetical protein